ncbi:unnamed protein product [Effrenium voratum]|nr:unnamed protein product [Effrenium voratum]
MRLGASRQVAISNPALLDPSLCPAGKLVLHLYGAGNEPFDIWAAAQAEGREAYEALKQERAERLWQALEERSSRMRAPGRRFSSSAAR